MKIVFNNYCRVAMTRVELLVVICVALIGIYLGILYQKNGEVLTITWKGVGKTNAVIETPPPAEAHSNRETDEPEGEITETQPVSTNAPGTLLVKKSNSETPSSKTSGMRLDDPRKLRLPVPTNAIWLPAQRRGPGVRIAFP